MHCIKYDKSLRAKNVYQVLFIEPTSILSAFQPATDEEVGKAIGNASPSPVCNMLAKTHHPAEGLFQWPSFHTYINHNIIT